MTIDVAETVKLWVLVAAPVVTLAGFVLNYLFSRRLQTAIENQKVELQRELQLQVEARKAEFQAAIEQQKAELQRELQLQVEARKAELLVKAQTEIEGLRAELQRFGIEHQARFVRLHEKRVEATISLFAKFAALHRTLGKEFGRLGSNTPDDAVRELVGKANGLYSEAEDSFRSQEILFDEDLAAAISKALNEWATMVGAAIVAVGQRYDTPEAATIARKAWLDKRYEALAVAQGAMKTLQQQLRRLLGAAT